MSTQHPSLVEYLKLGYAAGGPPPTALLFSRIGALLAFLAQKAGATPSMLTGAALVLGVSGAAVLGGASTPGASAAAALLLVGAYAFDCADGQLARGTQRTSEIGGLFDVASDMVVTSAVVVALASRLATDGLSVAETAGLGLFASGRTCLLLMSTLARSYTRRAWTASRRSHARALARTVTDTPITYASVCIAHASTLTATAALLGILSLAQVVGLAVSLDARSRADDTRAAV